MKSHTNESFSGLRIGLTGSGGFVGRRVARALKQLGATVVPFRRRAGVSDSSIEWLPGCELHLDEKFRTLDAIVHLAGEPIVGRWTARKKREIERSRVEGTTHLCEAAAKLEHKITIISASGTGYYGTVSPEYAKEADVLGPGFLAQVCAKWEAATRSASEAGHRVVIPRIGLVLGTEGGALAKMLLPFRMLVGGRVGSGQQWMSWISIDDLVKMILWMLETPSVSGHFNAVSPEPIRNIEFTKTLGAALHRPTIAPVPEAALRLLFGEMANETLLANQHVIPARALEMGFEFEDTSLAALFERIL